jgi:hypothetical protein
MRTFRTRLLAALTTVVLALGMGLFSVPAAGTLPATIKGQVLSWMDPLGYAKVTVFDAGTGTAIKSAITDGDGYYIVGGLPAGPVKVRATKEHYLPSWASGSATRASADVYTLVAGQTLEQTWDEQMVLYLDLAPESVITGQVMGFSSSPTSPWDDPVPGVTVTAFDAATGKVLGSAVTDYDGFRIGMLPAGQVKLRASKEGWLTTWAHDRWTKATAQTFDVQPFQPTDIGTFAIYAPASIQGQVSVDDEPIGRDITVTVVNADTGRAIASIVDDDGYFQVDGLPPVPVKVRATGPFTTTGWADWTTSEATAKVFTLVPGVVRGSPGDEAERPYINLISTGSISGQVLGNFDPLGYARVTVFDAATGQALRSATADGDGHYRIDKIPVGFAGRDINVRASKDGWLPAWANGIHLGAGQLLEQSWDPAVLYLDLAPESVITGQVMGFSSSPTSPWDDPVPGVTVTAFDAATGKVLGSAVTDYDGFRIGMLPAGQVKLRASKEGWLTTWAHDRWTKATAQTFDVQPFQPTDIGTFAIYAPASIQGQVSVDDEPIGRDITVTVVNADTGRAIASIVDDDGYFQVDGLPPVPVKVRATGPFTTTGWADWTTSEATAKVFTLVPGVVRGSPGDEAERPYINLISTGSISGQVLGNFDPLGYARVTVFDAATGQALRSATADGDGHYRIDKIPVGFAGRDINVRASKDGWLPSWANGKPSRATADTIHLGAGQLLEQSWDPMVLFLDLRPLS